MRLSARNVLRGRVTSIVHGTVNSEVMIEMPSGTVITSIVTKASVEQLGLAVGSDAYAVIKASNVMIAVD